MTYKPVPHFDFAKLIDWLNSPRRWFALWLAALSFVVLPPRVADTVGLTHLRDNYRGIAALVLLITTALLLVESFVAGRPAAERHWSEFIDARRKRKLVRSLTPNERRFLRYYFEKCENTQYLATDDELGRSLVSKGFIYRSADEFKSRFAGPGRHLGYDLLPWVRDYFAKAPKQLARMTR